MDSNVGLIGVGVVVVVLIVVGAVFALRKSGKAPGLDASLPEFGTAAKHLAGDLLVGMRAEFDALRLQLEGVLHSNETLEARYIDRDDFMKAVGAAKFATGIVLIDAANTKGKLVHNGTSPPVTYAVQEDGSVARNA